jgi:hypothetical protein
MNRLRSFCSLVRACLRLRGQDGFRLYYTYRATSEAKSRFWIEVFFGGSKMSEIRRFPELLPSCALRASKSSSRFHLRSAPRNYGVQVGGQASFLPSLRFTPLRGKLFLAHGRSLPAECDAG